MTQKLILVLNCGSSSLKGAVLDNDSGEVLLSCLAENSICLMPSLPSNSTVKNAKSIFLPNLTIPVPLKP